MGNKGSDLGAAGEHDGIQLGGEGAMVWDNPEDMVCSRTQGAVYDDSNLLDGLNIYPEPPYSKLRCSPKASGITPNDPQPAPERGGMPVRIASPDPERLKLKERVPDRARPVPNPEKSGLLSGVKATHYPPIALKTDTALSKHNVSPKVTVMDWGYSAKEANFSGNSSLCVNSSDNVTRGKLSSSGEASTTVSLSSQTPGQLIHNVDQNQSRAAGSPVPTAPRAHVHPAALSGYSASKQRTSLRTIYGERILRGLKCRRSRFIPYMAYRGRKRRRLRLIVRRPRLRRSLRGQKLLMKDKQKKLWIPTPIINIESLIRDGLENEVEDDADDVCIKDKLRQYLDSKVSQTTCTRFVSYSHNIGGGCITSSGKLNDLSHQASEVHTPENSGVRNNILASLPLRKEQQATDSSVTVPQDHALPPVTADRYGTATKGGQQPITMTTSTATVRLNSPVHIDTHTSTVPSPSTSEGKLSPTTTLDFPIPVPNTAIPIPSTNSLPIQVLTRHSFAPRTASTTAQSSFYSPGVGITADPFKTQLMNKKRGPQLSPVMETRQTPTCAAGSHHAVMSALNTYVTSIPTPASQAFHKSTIKTLPTPTPSMSFQSRTHSGSFSNVFNMPKTTSFASRDTRPSFNGSWSSMINSGQTAHSRLPLPQTNFTGGQNRFASSSQQSASIPHSLSPTRYLNTNTSVRPTMPSFANISSTKNVQMPTPSINTSYDGMARERASAQRQFNVPPVQPRPQAPQSVSSWNAPSSVMPMGSLTTPSMMTRMTHPTGLRPTGFLHPTAPSLIGVPGAPPQHTLPRMSMAPTCVTVSSSGLLPGHSSSPNPINPPAAVYPQSVAEERPVKRPRCQPVAPMMRPVAEHQPGISPLTTPTPNQHAPVSPINDPVTAPYQSVPVPDNKMNHSTVDIRLSHHPSTYSPTRGNPEALDIHATLTLHTGTHPSSSSARSPTTAATHQGRHEPSTNKPASVEKDPLKRNNVTKNDDLPLDLTKSCKQAANPNTLHPVNAVHQMTYQQPSYQSQTARHEQTFPRKQDASLPPALLVVESQPNSPSDVIEAAPVDKGQQHVWNHQYKADQARKEMCVEPSTIPVPRFSLTPQYPVMTSRSTSGLVACSQVNLCKGVVMYRGEGDTQMPSPGRHVPQPTSRPAQHQVPGFYQAPSIPKEQLSPPHQTATVISHRNALPNQTQMFTQRHISANTSSTAAVQKMPMLSITPSGMNIEQRQAQHNVQHHSPESKQVMPFQVTHQEHQGLMQHSQMHQQGSTIHQQGSTIHQQGSTIHQPMVQHSAHVRPQFSPTSQSSPNSTSQRFQQQVSVQKPQLIPFSHHEKYLASQHMATRLYKTANPSRSSGGVCKTNLPRGSPSTSHQDTMTHTVQAIHVDERKDLPDITEDDPDTHCCDWCGQTGACLLCSSCRNVRYCKHQCQLDHWSTHYLDCGSAANQSV